MFIGTTLRKLRDKQKLSQQEIADYLGVSQATYWNWENDETHFKVDHLSKLADILQVDPADILPDGAVVKIVNNKENKDSSINGFEVNLIEGSLTEKLVKSLEENINLLKEQNKSLKEENLTLKSCISRGDQ
jgi:transcriptional regulator with XRE-family HTH domain